MVLFVFVLQVLALIASIFMLLNASIKMVNNWKTESKERWLQLAITTAALFCANAALLASTISRM